LSERNPKNELEIQGYGFEEISSEARSPGLQEPYLVAKWSDVLYLVGSDWRREAPDMRCPEALHFQFGKEVPESRHPEVLWPLGLDVC
jgi:hypothetical protein